MLISVIRIIKRSTAYFTKSVLKLVYKETVSDQIIAEIDGH
jgi:hypothetical protein